MVPSPIEREWLRANPEFVLYLLKVLYTFEKVTAAEINADCWRFLLDITSLRRKI
jgi:hypothetical protein